MRDMYGRVLRDWFEWASERVAGQQEFMRQASKRANKSRAAVSPEELAMIEPFFFAPVPPKVLPVALARAAAPWQVPERSTELHSLQTWQVLPTL